MSSSSSSATFEVRRFVENGEGTAFTVHTAEGGRVNDSYAVLRIVVEHS